MLVSLLYTYLVFMVVCNGREKPHADKYKESTNYLNYDVSRTLCTSLPLSDLEHIKRLIFVLIVYNKAAVLLFHDVYPVLSYEHLPG
jgi:hypothetical protein